MIPPSTMTSKSDDVFSFIKCDSSFESVYTAVAGMQFSIHQQSPEKLLATIRSLARVLEKEHHDKQRQSYFLHKKTADTLKDIITGTHQTVIAADAGRVLVQCLSKSGSTALRAAAEALGALPVSLPPLPGPASPAFCNDAVAKDITWAALLNKTGEKATGKPYWKGRNLIVPLLRSGRVLTIKTAMQPDEQAMLYAEGAWMEHLSKTWPLLCDRPDIFTIPKPLSINGNYVFKLNGFPGAASGTSASRYATGFISHPDYFRYPNEHEPSRPLSNRKILSMLSNGAFILGKLTASGIIHTAPIPLFHNRVQRHRREDGGVYQWPRGGRLDRWLDSCRYPNIGKTGLRDFEHFIGFNDSPKKLYEYIGTHLLSLVLIAGSCFRNRDLSRVGFGPDGKPVDTRDLFDPILLRAALNRVFYAYYQGFTGKRLAGRPPLDMDRLTARLIEEMGVDRHMEEILRLTEQQNMTDQAFFDFLTDRGFLPEEIAGIKKGTADITIMTGPHLGAFNSRISLPELTEFTAVASAVCISDRYFQPPPTVSGSGCFCRADR